MKTKPKKKQVERVNEFHCCDKAFQHPEFITHLTEVHGFAKGTQCTRTMIQALDGADFFSNIFELTIPCGDATIKVQQVSSGPRGRDSWMTAVGDE